MKNIYRRLVEKFGAEKQIIVAIEELSELQKELCKYLRGAYLPKHPSNLVHIAEEIADTEIMIEQLKLIFDIAPLVALEKDDKIKRTEQRYFSEEGNVN